MRLPGAHVRTMVVGPWLSSAEGFTMIAGLRHNRGATMACVIIVEFRAKRDGVAAFAELIDRHAHNSRTLKDGRLAFDVF
jgi:hypothetical protein